MEYNNVMIVWSEVPGWGQAIDIGFAICIIVIVVIWTRRWQEEKQKIKDKKNDSAVERQLGFSAISNELNIGLMAASILLPACLILITLGRHEVNPLPAGVITQIVIAAVYFTMAICIGFGNAASSVTLVRSKNIARETTPNVLGAVQLFLTLFGAVILFSSFLIT